MFIVLSSRGLPPPHQSSDSYRTRVDVVDCTALHTYGETDVGMFAQQSWKLQMPECSWPGFLESAAYVEPRGMPD